MRNRSHFEILTTADEGRWREVMQQIGVYDFYHLPPFHRLAELRGEGAARLAVYTEDGCAIALPMLLRGIDTPGSGRIGTGLNDATSVYGYAGPVASPDLPEGAGRRFTQSLDGFFESEGVVCAFSRLHPLIEQSHMLDGCGEVIEVGATLSMDLTIPPEEQVARYRKRLRRDIKHLRKIGLTCSIEGPEYLEDFLGVYYGTMDRVSADGMYHFERSYFDYLAGEMSDVMNLFVCRAGRRVVSAAFFTACNGFIQGHLGGTADDFLELSPAKLLYDTVREWGNSIGARAVHLGGGVGAKRDSLYDFKMGFCGREHIYRTWRHIVDQRTYDDLCRDATRRAGVEPRGFYFPFYRHPEFQTTTSAGMEPAELAD